VLFIALRELTRQLDELRQRSIETNVDLATEIHAIERKIETTQRDIYSSLTPWQKVQIARHPKRPYALDYIQAITEGFQELHGDRQYNDDRAIIGGTAFLDGEAIMIVAQQKGRDPKERIARNFGMPQPEGYRKALRLMRLAEKFRLPVITFIDTPGAFPGIESEARHVSEAIAVNLREMAMLRTPTISVVVGEGGSGGALGIGVTDRVLISRTATTRSSRRRAAPRSSGKMAPKPPSRPKPSKSAPTISRSSASSTRSSPSPTAAPIMIPRRPPVRCATPCRSTSTICAASPRIGCSTPATSATGTSASSRKPAPSAAEIALRDLLSRTPSAWPHVVDMIPPA